MNFGEIDARGVKTTFSYDGLNRVESVSYTGESGYATPNVSYTYDELRGTLPNKGRLTTVKTLANVAQGTPETKQIYDYDNVGQVVNHTQTIGNQSYNLNYGYNLAGQLVSEKYPSGKVFNYSVDDFGRLQTVADSQRTYLSSVSFTNQGLLNQMNLGNGTSESFGYNDRFQMTSQNLNKGSQVLQKYDYGYGQIDASGNLDLTKNNGQLGKIESFIGTQKQSTQKFSYDSIGRLSDAKEYKGTDNSLTYKQKFDFDRFGNMYRKAANNGTAGQANPLPMTAIEDADISKSTNRFTTNTTYNEAGMVIADNKFRSMNFAYDANGRQVNATNSTNSTNAQTVYDALGNRVATKVNDVWQFVIYDAFGKLVAEYGTQAEGNGGVSYVLQDWQGSVRASVNANGFIQARFDFTAFGEEISLGVGTRSIEQGYSGDATTRQGYGLTEKDSSGLNHTWFRKQEQRAGRWTSPDPYKGSMNLGNPQSFNRYSYVDNDPTNFIDPGGLLKQGDRCYITQPDGTQIPGKTDQYGGCNPDLGNIQPVYIYWNDLFPIFGNITRPGDLYPSRGPDIEVGGGGCGVNPATGSSGIAVDSGNPRGGRPGGLGHLRPGVGGAGGFKERTGGKHGGNDIVAPVGTPIHANRGGTVVATQFGYNGGYGNTVIISHGGIYTQYSHLTSISVSAGASVNQGQIIGTSGRTGNVPRRQANNEDHVHFEVFSGSLNSNFRPNGSNRRNPTNYLNSPCP